MMKRTRYLTVVFATLLPVTLLFAAQSGCGKKDDDDTKPTASVAPPPPPPPAPTAPAVVTPEEDAGAASDAADGSDGKAVVTGTGGGASASIAKCCAALQQNANSAPIEQKGAYQAAATACQGLKGTPVAQQAFSQIRAFLAGAKMPGACQ
jgi:hypothetical protein